MTISFNSVFNDTFKEIFGESYSELKNDEKSDYYDQVEPVRETEETPTDKQNIIDVIV